MIRYFTACVAAAARSRLVWLTVLAVFSLLAGRPSVRADITPYGDVFPSDPSTWDNSTTGYIGNTASGTLTVDGGSGLLSLCGYIGYGSAATGVVNIAGSGSTWNFVQTGDSLYAGNSGSGTLSITSGGSVNNFFGYSYIGYNSGSTGLVTVDGTGSTWNSGVLLVGGSGSGTLSVTNGGTLSGIAYIGYGSGSTGVVTVDGTGSTWGSGGINVGYAGGGTLSISSGGNVSSSDGCAIGDYSGSQGVVTVDGVGSTWTHGGSLFVGNSGGGALSITNGGSASTANGPNSSSYIGYSPGSTGVVTVDGAGSTWTNTGYGYLGSGDVYVGNSGSGAVNITNGGTVSVSGTTYVGFALGSTGTINFGTNGGTLTTKSLCASPSQLAGTGTINTSGLVSDTALIFDSTHGLKQTVTFQQPGQNVTVNLDMASTPNINGALGAGWWGAGSLTIQDGIKVNSADGYLGYQSGSTGVAMITGTGSTWTNNYYLPGSGYLYVGYSGNGTFSISNGGSVSNSNGYGYVGNCSGSKGVVAVDGTGSTWNSGGSLFVGNSGSGTVSITNGGCVSDRIGYIGNYSGSKGVVKVDGTGSTWTNSGYLNSGCLYIGNSGGGTLSISNGGSVYSNFSSVGTYAGSTGLVTIDGIGSTWTNSGSLYVFCVGNSGSGTLSITNGGCFSDSINCYIGLNSGSTGVVNVDGIGSTWNNS
jgi:T5SS/PEP-CTERM-associated repeat protein